MKKFILYINIVYGHVPALGQAREPSKVCTATTPTDDNCFQGLAESNSDHTVFNLRLPSPNLMNVYILAQAQGQTRHPSPEQR